MFVQTEFNKSNNNNGIGRVSPQDGIVDAYEDVIKDLDLISRFCMSICSKDNEIREVALEGISKTVEGWLDGVGSPKHYRLNERHHRGYHQSSTSSSCACSNITVDTVKIPQEYLDLVSLHLPIILRLSLSCPFENVREKCQHILELVRVSIIFFSTFLVCSSKMYFIDTL